MKNYTLYLLSAITFFTFFDRESFSQTAVVSRAEKYRDILITADSLNLGFPFNDANRLAYNKYSFAIGDQIKTLQQNGFLSANNRKQVLRDIIDVNWKIMKKLPLEGYLNIGYVQSEEPESDVCLLFAALVVVSKTGEIENIAPFLEFSKVFFGDAAEASQNPPYISSMANYYVNKDLTEIQRKSFWPASNAILNHATTTIPLLAAAVQDTKLAELLRLRAAAYLREMAPDVLNEEFIGKCEEPIAIKIRCILDKKATWDGVGLNICDPYDEKHIQSAQRMANVFESARKNRPRKSDSRQ
jgi:hypothetical protein